MNIPNNDVRYIDIHSHLNDARFDPDRDAVITRMRDAGVATIAVGTDKNMTERAIACAEQYENVFASIGQHPVDNRDEVFDMIWYEAAANHLKVLAIGECGLDYYWPSKDGWKNGEEIEKKRQKELFEKHISIAKKMHKSLMIHGRPTSGGMDAYKDMLGILQGESGVNGNVHFFVGNSEIAKAFLDLGFCFSFTGVITFSREYDEVIKYIPIDRIHAETDSPYVAPVPYRGKRNEPINVIEIIQKLAEIKNISFEQCAEQLSKNFENFFANKK